MVSHNLPAQRRVFGIWMDEAGSKLQLEFGSYAELVEPDHYPNTSKISHHKPSPPPPTMPPPPPPPSPAPTLPDELLEEIFLRLPPDEPACLVRASLASKLWHAPLTGPAFRGRYREFHGPPPMLGFFHFSYSDSVPPFVPTVKLGARFPVVDDDWTGWHNDYTVWDCRHGHVLLCNNRLFPLLLVSWDPMTGRRSELRPPQDYDSASYAATVLCGVIGCDHRACHEGAFRVVFVGLDYTDDDGCVAYAHVSLSEVGDWSKPCSAHLATKSMFTVDRPPLCIQQTFYLLLTYGYDDADNADDIVVLKYDLRSSCLSLIDAPPPETDPAGDAILMAMEDGGLGFARLEGLTLYLWSRQMGSDGVPAWTRRRVMDVKNILPGQNPKKRVRLVGTVEGTDIIFLTTDLGIYEINLKSLRWKKIWKREELHLLIPYRSFYNQPESVSSCDAVH